MDDGFWPGWSLSAVGDVATVVLTVFALALGIRYWAAASILKLIEGKRHRWPVRPTVINAWEESENEDQVDADEEENNGYRWSIFIGVKPRWGTWSARNSPRVDSVFMSFGEEVGGQTLLHGLTVNKLELPVTIDSPVEFVAHIDLPPDLTTLIDTGTPMRVGVRTIFPPRGIQLCFSEPFKKGYSVHHPSPFDK